MDGDRNSRQRSILCDTVLGTTLCDFRSAQEGSDVTCDDAMLHAISTLLIVIGCMNMQENMRRGENLG